jgi:hypothetical protein
VALRTTGRDPDRPRRAAISVMSMAAGGLLAGISAEWERAATGDPRLLEAVGTGGGARAGAVEMEKNAEKHSKGEWKLLPVCVASDGHVGGILERGRTRGW